MKSITADKLPQEHSTEFQGLPVIIEWPAGSTRVGTTPEGKTFKTEMKADYGYIPDTTGVGDQEKVDIYIGPDKDAEYAYIVEQIDDSGEFDEYKILLGFDTLEEAEKTYLEHVPEKYLGDISEVKFDYLFDIVKEHQEEQDEQKTSSIVAELLQNPKSRKTADQNADRKYTVIEAFLKNYEHEVDFYQECASLVQDKLDQALQEAGIKAVVSSRAKRPSRLEKKLFKRDKKKHYQSFREIYDDIVDLAGCRVALYMPADRDHVGTIINQLFVSVREPKHFPESSQPEEGDTLGYVATHYLVRLRPETLRKKELRYADTQVEIQVASVLMHAWAEVTHDLLYKPEKGKLTPQELKLLNDLNQIVQAGEQQLEKLQEAIEGRTSEDLRFEIAAALADNLKDRSAGKVASLTLDDVKCAAEAIADPVMQGKPPLDIGGVPVYASSQPFFKAVRAIAKKADNYREMWERAGYKFPDQPTGDMGYVHQAMDEIVPGKPYNTLAVLPSDVRSKVYQRAQELKVEALKK